MSTSYPSSASATASSSKTPAGASLSAKRLFVGNLSESADEYTIIQFLSRYGKIAKFDFLFHKSGPKRGRPRGYAFVEYATAEEALKTTLELNDKLLMGRKISIKAANEAPDYSNMPGGSGAWRGSGQKSTTLSILKGHQKPVSRQGKISALEAKLQALESERAGTPSGAESEGDSRGGTPSTSVDVPTTSALASTGTSSAMPSLPSKPTRDTIQRGEAARRAKEDSAPDRYDSSKQKDKFLARTGKAQKEEAPKVTLASLGLSMTQ